jgi:hypothetical protein
VLTAISNTSNGGKIKNMTRLFMIIVLLAYLISHKFFCFFIEGNGFQPCYYEGFGFPEQPLLYWIKVLFLLIFILIISLKKNIFSLDIKIYLALIILYIFFEFISDAIRIMHEPILRTIYLLTLFSFIGYWFMAFYKPPYPPKDA